MPHSDTDEGWGGHADHCRLCAERVEAMCQQFDRDVVEGKYDSAGFTVKERKRQEKKFAKAAAWKDTLGASVRAVDIQRSHAANV